MAARLIESLATTEAFAELFSDASVLQAMLDFEVGLARAEARVGIVPRAAAEAIAAAAKARIVRCRTACQGRVARRRIAHPAGESPDRKGAASRSGSCGIRSLGRDQSGRRRYGAGAAAQTGTAGSGIRSVAIWKARCDDLAETHAKTVMLGRTLLQAAPPTTFGLKAAGWLGSIRRCRLRLSSAFREALMVQLGGATGTLASLGEHGIDVGRALADELQLGFPKRPGTLIVIALPR